MYHVTIVDLGRSLHGVLGDAMPRCVDAEAEGAVFWDEFGRAWARDAYGRQVPSLHIEDFGIIGPRGIAAPLYPAVWACSKSKFIEQIDTQLHCIHVDDS